MKFILVIAGVLAVLAVVQARPQEAENDNQEEAIEVLSESEQDSDQEKNDNQIPELPHDRPHIHHPGQQQPAPPRGSSSGRNPRPHHQSHPHRPQEQRPEPQPEQGPNQDNSVIDEAEQVWGIGLHFQS